MDNRRKHARFNSSVIMQYKDGIFALSFDTVTKDVSLGGVCFFLKKGSRQGRKLRSSFIMIQIHRQKKLRARSSGARFLMTNCSRVI